MLGWSVRNTPARNSARPSARMPERPLNPCRFVLDWVVRYWQSAKQVGLPVNPDIDAFYRDFEYMALQRHLKILGIFCRLNYRDGKSTYMGDLSTVMDYVRKTANRYTELKPLLRLLDAFDDKAPQVGYTF